MPTCLDKNLDNDSAFFNQVLSLSHFLFAGAGSGCPADDMNKVVVNASVHTTSYHATIKGWCYINHTWYLSIFNKNEAFINLSNWWPS